MSSVTIGAGVVGAETETSGGGAGSTVGGGASVVVGGGDGCSGRSVRPWFAAAPTSSRARRAEPTMSKKPKQRGSQPASSTPLQPHAGGPAWRVRGKYMSVAPRRRTFPADAGVLAIVATPIGNLGDITDAPPIAWPTAISCCARTRA